MKTFSGWRTICLLVVFMVVGGACERTHTDLGLSVVADIPAGGIVKTSAVLLTASIPDGDAETRELYYPLEWTVSHPGLGFIRDAAGDSAVYESTSDEGANSVVVRDQIGAEGVVALSHGTTE